MGSSANGGSNEPRSPLAYSSVPLKISRAMLK